MLKAYAEKFHVGPGWLFLTGKKADITRLQQKLGLSAEPDPANRDGHAPNLMLGNEATGQWMRNTAVDNPQFLAVMIGDSLNVGRRAKRSRATRRSPQLTLDPGQHLFQTRCAACHTLGQGDRMGPDLRGVTARRDRAWLARFIATPDQLLAEGDPIATELFAQYKQVQMPNLRLGEADVAILLKYLEEQGTARQGGDPRKAVAHLPADGRESVHEPHHVEAGGVK